MIAYIKVRNFFLFNAHHKFIIHSLSLGYASIQQTRKKDQVENSVSSCRSSTDRLHNDIQKNRINRSGLLSQARLITRGQRGAWYQHIRDCCTQHINIAHAGGTLLSYRLLSRVACCLYRLTTLWLLVSVVKKMPLLITKSSTK